MYVHDPYVVAFVKLKLCFPSVRY